MNSMSLSNSFEKRGDDRIRTTLKNLLEFRSSKWANHQVKDKESLIYI